MKKSHGKTNHSFYREKTKTVKKNNRKNKKKMRNGKKRELGK